MIALVAVVSMDQKLAALVALVPCGGENTLRIISGLDTDDGRGRKVTALVVVVPIDQN